MSEKMMTLDELIAAHIHEELEQFSWHGMGASYEESFARAIGGLERKFDSFILFQVAPEDWSHIIQSLGAKVIYELGINGRTAVKLRSSKLVGYVVSEDSIARGESRICVMMPVPIGKIVF